LAVTANSRAAPFRPKACYQAAVELGVQVFCAPGSVAARVVGLRSVYFLPISNDSSARPPGPEERCRTAARSFVAASHDGGPTGFWSTQRSRHNRGMIRPRRGTVVRHGATTGGSDEVPRWRHRGGRPGEAGSPHRFAGVEGSWRGMRAGFARCEQLAERRDAPTGSPGGGADKRNRPPA
jgi:hypothetical protein